MPGIVLGGAVRYAVNQRLAGRDVVNIVDMHIDVNAPTTSRSEAVEAVAGDVLNNWHDHILIEQVDNLEAQSVSWVDLDTANGSVGSRSTTSEHSWPAQGLLVAPNPFPGMVALRVIKNTTGGRLARKGRMYLAGFDEDKTVDSPNNWRAEFVSAMQTKMDDFLSGLRETGTLADVVRYPIVIHQAKDGDVTGTEITSYSIDSLMGTQRRRTRG